VAEHYAQQFGIAVEVQFKTRQEMESLLLGEYQGEVPSVVFSTEWPFVGAGAQDLTGLVPTDDYLEPAASFWTYDDRLMGVPSYVHWLCTAKRAGTDNSSGMTGYLSGSPGFLHSGLDYGSLDWTGEDICTYAEWVRQTYGLRSQAVLDLWRQNRIEAIFPVTPHLFKWMKLSENGGEIHLLPIDNPEGTPRFYFSVPGYVVMEADEEILEFAVGLAQVLAAARGRWAARAIGCIPALRSDIPLFDVESGFTREQRVLLMTGFFDSDARISDRTAHGHKIRICQAVVEVIEEYLSGEADRDQLEQGIHAALKSHTIQSTGEETK
jgi:hypothetical protein